jgi:hypothetical protein
MTEIKFDFETQAATPFRSGGLTTLTETQSGLTMTIRRGSSAFDIVANTGTQQKPAAFGNRSLDPFTQPDNPTPFLINFSSLVYSVSVTMGDADPDTDVLWLKAYARENAEGRLIATYTDTLTANSADPFTSKVLTITSDIPFRSIELLGGSPPARNSVYYDNIIVNTEAPATPPNDNTPVNARNLGTLTGNYTIQDFVDTTDPADYYKFNLDYVTNLNANLAGLSGSVRMYLYRDWNGNGLIDTNEVIDNRISNPSGNIFQILTPGTYFLKAEQYYDSTRYDLTITTTAHPNYTPAIDPGNSDREAFNLGTLSGTITLKDYIGSLDGHDYYKFSLSSLTDFNANLAGLSGSVRMYLYRDWNGNGLIDANEVIDNRISIAILLDS